MPHDLCKWCSEALDAEQIAEKRRYCCNLHRTLWTERHRKAIRRGDEPKLMVREPDHYYSKLRAKPAIYEEPAPVWVQRLRLAERDDCEHYDRCLHDVACARQRFVPCVGCKAYLHIPNPVSILHSNWPDEAAFPGREVAA